MLHFEIGQYSVCTGLQRVHTSAGVQTHASRILKLTGRPCIDAAIYRASLQFSSLFDPWYSRPTTGRLDRSDPQSPRISVWLPLSEFPCYYDILRCERSVFFACAARLDGFLTHVRLSSSASIEDLGQEERVDMCSAH